MKRTRSPITIFVAFTLVACGCTADSGRGRGGGAGGSDVASEGGSGGGVAGGEGAGAGGGEGGGDPACADGDLRCGDERSVQACTAGAWVPLALCPAGTICAAGECTADECQPVCGDRVCGGDGCGDSCGDCEGEQSCSAEGLCVDPPRNCGDEVCGDDEDCLTCPADCGGCCGDDECRPAHDESCSTCPADCGCRDDETCNVERGLCIPDCQAECDDRECGDDGCGSVCGECDEGQVCSNGACNDQPDTCDDDVCDDGETCENCPADCGPCCGDDECVGRQGENCATCPADCACDADEACDLDRNECVDACVPDCRRRECGDDGCGNVCGGCDRGDSCEDGVCVSDCDPRCDDVECGDDGCGGVCDVCDRGDVCREGVCVAECDDECGELWETQCTADNAAYRRCIPDPDRQGCTRQSRRVPCDEGRQCGGGGCRGGCTQPQIILVVDRSSSMEGERWEMVAGVIGEFCSMVGAAADVFIRLFPAADACSAGNVIRCDGRPVQVPSPLGETPISAGLTDLEGTFGDPNEVEAVILITDGDETCEDELAGVVPVALLRNRDVETFAIGVSRQANPELLGDIGRAGGTDDGNPGFYRADDREALWEALVDIYDRVEGCGCTPEQAGDTRCYESTLFTCNGESLAWEWWQDAPGASCTCERGDSPTRCLGDGAVECRGGRWSRISEPAPPFDVCDGACEPEQEGESRCRDGLILACEEEEWIARGQAPDDECACEVAPEPQCQADNVIVCQDAVWTRFPFYPDGFDVCDNLCTELNDNEAHCGRCGNECEDDVECIRGECGQDFLQWEGIRNDVAKADVLAGGWQECFTNTYRTSGPDVLGDIGAACDGAWLMMACAATGSDTLRVAAHAPRADVFFDMGELDATHEANGVGWYYGRDESWGFAPVGAVVSRNSCDVADRADNRRICWHTRNGQLSGGWRCGSQTGLNSSSAWHRIVYHVDP